jgi:hypothetical protein
MDIFWGKRGLQESTAMIYRDHQRLAASVFEHSQGEEKITDPEGLK